MAPTRKAPPMTRLKGVRNPPKRQRPAANIRTCPNAACTQSKIEDHEGQRVCENCGTVISDSNIVSEVQFGETSSGAAVVQGGFVGADQTHAHTMGSAFKRAGGMESREVSEANGKRYINQLAAALHIPPATSDAAFQMYKLASYNNFIQGRRTKNVAAVCLYVACRKQKRNSVMLIDFSDVLNINVFKLGQTFKDFTKELEITGYEPILPENLVYRFATKLEFGRLTEQVAQDAARLVQRMDRDWMTTGRRPSGICGACLILAARMNNFRRTVREVVYIVKVTDMTINRRLEEFKSTESSNLTVEQFRIIQLEKRHDPPAFYEQQNGNTRKRKRVHNVENDEGEGQVETTTNTTQRPLRRDKDGFAIPDIPIDPTLIAASASALSELTSSSPSDKSIVSTATNEPPAKRTRSATAAATATPSSQSSQPKANNNGLGIPPSSQSATTDKENTPAQPQPAPRRPRGRPRKDGTSRPEPPDPTVADLAVEQELENEISQYLNDPTTQEHAEAYSAAQASAAALTHASSSSSSMDIPMSVEIADTEFADDPEVANCVLSPEEREIKERIWVHENRDYLREQQRKLLRRQMEERSGIKKVARKRKNKAGRDGGDGGDAASVASSPGQSVVEVLKQKGFRFSKKINYEAVMETYDRGASRAASREASRAASEVRSPAAPGVAAEPRVEGNTQVDGGDTVVDLAEDDDGSDFTAADDDDEGIDEAIEDAVDESVEAAF